MATLTTAANAGVIYSAFDAVSVLHGGDRELRSIQFTGAANGMTGEDFLRFSGGSLHVAGSGNSATLDAGWTAGVVRDMSSSGNGWMFNPDRADSATPFAAEPGNTATIAEVFGPSAGGYKNMSWILDGEETSRTYWVDLMFAGNFVLTADNDESTVEVALLERGRNSDMNLYGIFSDGSLTGPLFVSRNAMGQQLWTLDTVEIGGAQKVVGAGISLDPTWTGLVGLRIESAGASFDGPDLVGVGVTNAIPEPATLTLGIIGLASTLRRRR